MLEGAFDLKVEKTRGPKPQAVTLHWDAGVLLPIGAVAAADQAGLYLEAVVSIAVQAAKLSAPLTAQKNLYPWQLAEIERACGKRPTNKEVKAELARAVALKRLRYIKGHGKQRAGYFPFEEALTRQRRTI